MLDTRNKLQIPGTSSTIQPEYNNCDSCNIVYLLMCDSENYIGETSINLRLRFNNHIESIRDNSRGFSVAVHFNQPNHAMFQHGMLQLWKVMKRYTINKTECR